MDEGPPANFERQERSYPSVGAAQADASRVFPTPADLRRFLDYGFNGEKFVEEHFSRPFIPACWATPLEAPKPPVPFDQSRVVKKYEQPYRARQEGFRTAVFGRYGSKCAMCRVACELLLDAAHIIAWKDRGADTPENGLVLCKLHHYGLDLGTIKIDPVTLKLHCCANGLTFAALHVELDDLTHLKEKTDPRALRWLWNRN